MIYAITINQQHKIYDYDINYIANEIENQLKGGMQYLELVEHKPKELVKEHYHGLLITNYSINYFKELQWFHVEQVRNVKAYQKYMRNHDYDGNEKILGSLPYIEQNDNEVIDYVMKHGPVRAVQQFGWKVLKSYHALKMFYEDFEEYKAINGIAREEIN